MRQLEGNPRLTRKRRREVVENDQYGALSAG